MRDHCRHDVSAYVYEDKYTFKKEREVEICNVYVYGYGYSGNHRNFLRITSSISAITRFLHVFITCGAASTRWYKRVACKIKTSQMMNFTSYENLNRKNTKNVYVYV